MSEPNQETNLPVEQYDEKHCVEVMKLLNTDRKVKKTFCDGMLQAESKQFSVHKCIVGLVSEFLNKLLTSNMREKYEKVVKISNMTDVVLGSILDFIYTGFVKRTPDNVFDLLEGAEYMQVDGLKSSCKDYLVESTNVENCLKFRAYGQRYNLDEVCDASDQFIAENFSDVIQHEDFNELDADALSQLINTIKERIYDEVVFTGIIQWVNHNMDQRQDLFLHLFSLVDLSALSKAFLNDTILTEPLVFKSFECLQHLLNPSGPLALVTKSSAISDKIFVIGGDGSEKSCVTYHAWEKHPLNFLLNENRVGAAAVKIKHHLYIAGGGDKVYESSGHQSVEMLNMQNPKEWVKIADMLEKRQFAASVVSNGRMVVTGGKNENVNLCSCEIYHRERNQWIPMKPMLQTRWVHDMVSLNGLLYCVGGTDGSNILSSAECYDEKIDEWKEIAPMPTARCELALVALNGFIYAIGGCSPSRRTLRTVERYSPETNIWTRRGDLNVARRYPGVFVMNGTICVVGGKGVKSVEVYDEAKDAWEVCFDLDTVADYSAVIAV